MRILDLIGEATEYDKKEALEEKRPKSWLKSVSAFANGIGGVLIFGVTDDEKPVGLTDAKLASEKISENIKVKMDPIPQIILEIHEEEGKQFLLLRVFSGQETPYYYVADGNRIAFVRIGNESVPADASALKRLVLYGSGKSYDSLPSPYRFNDYAFTKLRSVYRSRTGKELDESDFVSFGLMDKSGILTNAGALLADESPIRHSRLFCTRWYGLDKASGIMEALDDKEFSGSLISLLQNGEEFVKNNTKKRWKKTGQGRLEMPEYPEQAVLEAIVNSLIHRDYLDIGSEVHIDIFDNRMEIYSPGGMYDGSVVQNLDTDRVPSRRRNPIIADVFSRMHYMERRGSGFKKIKADYLNAEHYKPELAPSFYSTRTAFYVTLYNLNYDVPVENVVFDQGNVAFGAEDMVFDQDNVVFGGRKESVDACLAKMKATQATKAKIKVLFLAFQPEGIFSRADLMNSLAISSNAAGNLLKKMEAAGLIKPISGRGKGKYTFALYSGKGNF